MLCQRDIKEKCACIAEKRHEDVGVWKMIRYVCVSHRQESIVVSKFVFALCACMYNVYNVYIRLCPSTYLYLRCFSGGVLWVLVMSGAKHLHIYIYLNVYLIACAEGGCFMIDLVYFKPSENGSQSKKKILITDCNF